MSPPRVDAGQHRPGLPVETVTEEDLRKKSQEHDQVRGKSIRNGADEGTVSLPLSWTFAKFVNVIPLDTTAQAHRAQVEVYRRMGPEGRLQRAMTMCDEAREISQEGIRARHPEYGAESVKWALFRLVLGDALFRAAYPGRPLLPP